jgi:hypothetical protein|tara:strand:+ start:75 stop:179 length:105 start_codon:yes stop_codon:yes gene_type:complete
LNIRKEKVKEKEKEKRKAKFSADILLNVRSYAKG